jgi:putative ABC transport system permease protein
LPNKHLNPMLRYYIKLAIRKFQSNRLIVAGSIVTVSLGTLCISLLFSYVHNELTMDDFFQRKTDIYMTLIRDTPESNLGAMDAGIFFNLSYKDFPELENQVSVKKYPKGEMSVSTGESVFTPEILVVDSTFFEIFDFNLIAGNEKKVLTDPGSAIVSEAFARVIFGNKNPIGQEIKVINSNISYTINGIAENIPSNSSITFDLIIPAHSASDGNVYSRLGAFFLLANNKFNLDAFNKKIKDLGHVHFQFKESSMSVISLKDIYFAKDIGNNSNSIFSRWGDKRNIHILMVIIVVILIITILNFSGLQVIILNTGLKNIGLSKIMGLNSVGFLFQKTVEMTILIIMSSLIVSMAYVIVLPYFNNFTGVILNPSIGRIMLMNMAIIALLFTLAIVYPAIINIHTTVTNSLKGKISSGSFLSGQKVIVTIQYAFTIVLIISSVVIFRQVFLMLNKDLGFDSRNVMRVKMFKRNSISNISKDERKKNREQQEKSYQYIVNELSSNPHVECFAQGNSPLNIYDMLMKKKGGEKDYQTQSILIVHPGYSNLLGLKMNEGRFFDAQIDQSRGNKIIINEAAKKYWGIKEIDDNRMLNKHWGDSSGFEIIGVVKDFNFQHLSVTPRPLYMFYFNDIDNDFLIKIKSGSIQAGLQEISRLFKEVNPGEDFNYSFLSDEIDSLYLKEKRLSQIIFFFTMVGVLITAISIIIISIYDAQRRTKEIGIRKVNGARTVEIITLLNRDLIKLVVIAFIIACPIAWCAMHQWLQNFAYRTELSWWVFMAAGATAVLVALLTVSWQSWRAATRNPVEALRYE